MAISTYAGNKLLDAICRNISFQASPYASLHSADPALTGANELSGNGYGTRPAVTFGAASGGATDNIATVSLPTATGDWTAATHQGLWDAATDGNFLWGGALTDARTVLSGESAEWAVGALDAAISTAFSAATRTAMLDALLRNTALAYAALWISLHSADPGTDGSNELSGGGYGRWQATFGDAAADKAISNTAVADSPLASGDWTAATHLGLWTLETGGTFVWGKQLTAPRTVLTGKLFRVAIGGITLSIDPA